jgi:hypothetical protein
MDFSRCPETNQLHSIYLSRHPLWEVCKYCKQTLTQEIIDLDSSPEPPASAPDASVPVPPPPSVRSRAPAQLQRYHDTSRGMSFPSSTRSSSFNFTQATDIASAHRQEDPNGPPRNQSIIYTFKASIWGGTRTIIRRAGFPGFRWNIQKAHNFDKIRIPSTTAARSQAELIGKVFDAANYVLPMGTAKDPLSLANCLFLSSASSSGGHSAVVELALNPHNPITITEIRSLCTTVNP